jgi:hypothetical protein
MLEDYYEGARLYAKDVHSDDNDQNAQTLIDLGFASEEFVVD